MRQMHRMIEPFAFNSVFQDKKDTWTLFFSDQNETTMRVIGLAMHQVFWTFSLVNDNDDFVFNSVSSMNKKRRIVSQPVNAVIQRCHSSIFRSFMPDW